MSGSAGRGAVAVAERLAFRSPEAMMPCPVCGVSLRGENLERHLRRTHDITSGTSGGGEASFQRLVLRGSDRAALGHVMLVLACWAVAAAAVYVWWEPSLPDTRLGIALAGGAVVTAAWMLAFWAGWFRARLVVDDERVAVRGVFGLRRRSVARPVELVAGSLTTGRRTNMTNSDDVMSTFEDKVSGSYLRLGHGRRGIVVGCPGRTHLGGRWGSEGWTRGRRRSGRVIDLPPEGQFALEYRLAADGLLAPKTD